VLRYFFIPMWVHVRGTVELSGPSSRNAPEASSTSSWCGFRVQGSGVRV